MLLFVHLLTLLYTSFHTIAAKHWRLQRLQQKQQNNKNNKNNDNSNIKNKHNNRNSNNSYRKQQLHLQEKNYRRNNIYKINLSYSKNNYYNRNNSHRNINYIISNFCFRKKTLQKHQTQKLQLHKQVPKTATETTTEYKTYLNGHNNFISRNNYCNR